MTLWTSTSVFSPEGAQFDSPGRSPGYVWPSVFSPEGAQFDSPGRSPGYLGPVCGLSPSGSNIGMLVDPGLRPGLSYCAPSGLKTGTWLFSIGAALLAEFFLTGCQQKMAEQPSLRPDEPSDFFADGQASRPAVPGTVARGQLRTDLHFFTGKRTPG